MRLSDWQSFWQCIMGQRWLRFGIVGLAATASYFFLGLFFVSLLRSPVLLGNAAAYLISFAISYLGQSVWTFRAGGQHRQMLPRFALAQAIGLALNSCIIKICLNLGLPYPAAMLLAIILVPIPVYLICKFWVFQKTREVNN